MDKLVFVLFFVLTVGSACVVAFSRNLIYSAFALMGTFLGVAGIFIQLSADFLGLAQIVVYAGGILVLIIFAVMLSARMNKAGETNRALQYKYVLPLMFLLIAMLGKLVTSESWKTVSETGVEPTTSAIGNGLLGPYLLPFEVISVLLLVTMVGAAIITRRMVK